MIVSDGLLIAQAAATLFMTGLIWFIQIVHYPSNDLLRITIASAG